MLLILLLQGSAIIVGMIIGSIPFYFNSQTRKLMTEEINYNKIKYSENLTLVEKNFMESIK